MSLKKLILISLAALPLVSFGLERAELLPKEAHISIQISDTTDFWAQLQKSSLGKLWKDQQFQDFLGNPDMETWEGLFFKDEKTAENQMFIEQLKMFNGELILSFDMEHDAPYVIAAMSKEDFIRSLDLDDRMRESMAEPFDIVRDSFQDVEIIKHIQAPGQPSESYSWQAHVDTTFVMGNTREWVEQCIVRLRKDKADEPKGNPVLDINLPLAKMIEKTITQGGVSERAMFEALGIMDIDNFSAKIELQDEQMVIDNILRIGELSKGLFTILDVEPSELPTVTFIPENIASIEVGRFNLLALWQEIPNVLLQAQPEMKPQFDMLQATIQQQAGINLEQDILAHLGKQYIAFSTVDGPTQESVMAVDLEDGVAFKKGLETVLSAPALQPFVSTGIEIEDFLDHTIYTLKNAAPEDAMGISMTDDYLLYGTPNGLRQVIRSENSDAASNQDFERTELVRTLREVVPPRAFGYSAIDWKKNMDAVLNELTNPEYLTLLKQQWAAGASSVLTPDSDKLPPNDHIASFFNVSYQYVEASVQGLHQKIILKY